MLAKKELLLNHVTEKRDEAEQDYIGTSELLKALTLVYIKLHSCSRSPQWLYEMQDTVLSQVGVLHSPRDHREAV